MTRAAENDDVLMVPFGYPFDGQSCPLVSARVRLKTNAPPGHLWAGSIVGECSEGLT
jgi:hypothetical protein